MWPPPLAPRSPPTATPPATAQAHTGLALGVSTFAHSSFSGSHPITLGLAIHLLTLLAQNTDLSEKQPKNTENAWKMRTPDDKVVNEYLPFRDHLRPITARTIFNALKSHRSSLREI